MKPMKFGIGQAVKRVEDIRLVTGKGCYTADEIPAGALRAVFLRSSHANASFTVKDTAAAAGMPGVRAVYTIADFPDFHDLPCNGAVGNSDGTKMPLPPYPVLAKERVVHVGDAIAFVVAETEAQARLAIEAIEVDYKSGPASVDLQAAILPGAPLVWPQFGTNVAYDNAVGDKAATDAAFAGAAYVVAIAVVNNRLVSNYLEPRAAIASHGKVDGHYTLVTGTQGVHGMRDNAALVMGVDAKSIHVVTHDVGGGFGTKGFLYREYPALLGAAAKLGHTVAWICDRSEHFLADAHGRDNHTKAEMAMDANGRFLALRVHILGGLGAYLQWVRDETRPATH